MRLTAGGDDFQLSLYFADHTQTHGVSVHQGDVEDLGGRHHRHQQFDEGHDGEGGSVPRSVDPRVVQNHRRESHFHQQCRHTVFSRLLIQMFVPNMVEAEVHIVDWWELRLFVRANAACCMTLVCTSFLNGGYGPRLKVLLCKHDDRVFTGHYAAEHRALHEAGDR